jgi:phosphoenolpyruvate synthase/pyruvate phosphate dikinase
MGFEMTDPAAESTEVTETTDETPGLESRSPEELLAEIRQLRKEAAGRRVANREKDAELEEFRKWKDAQKTELERTAERAAQAEKELQALRRERLQEEVARAVGLDPDLADRIRGESKEEMLEDARKMAEKASPGKSAQVADLFKGARGAPVKGEMDTSAAFNQWIRSN